MAATWHKKLGRVHTQLYLRSGGWLGANLAGVPMLLLTTTGRRSGLPRTVALAYVRDGDRYIIVGSNAGGAKAPAWCWNLRTLPQAEIQVGRRRYWVSTHEAETEERTRLWSKVKRRVPIYAWYERKTQRLIPLVVLKPQ